MPVIEWKKTVEHHFRWVACPNCGNSHFVKLREDTKLINYPAYCKKCKQEIILNEPRAEIS